MMETLSSNDHAQVTNYLYDLFKPFIWEPVVAMMFTNMDAALCRNVSKGADRTLLALQSHITKLIETVGFTRVRSKIHNHGLFLIIPAMKNKVRL